MILSVVGTGGAADGEQHHRAREAGICFRGLIRAGQDQISTPCEDRWLRSWATRQGPAHDGETAQEFTGLGAP